jgi:hypothetical protein
MQKIEEEFQKRHIQFNHENVQNKLNRLSDTLAISDQEASMENEDERLAFNRLIGKLLETVG